MHDFIMNLPDNYDFDVKERGVMLSSQRQLIAFLSLCEQPEYSYSRWSDVFDSYSEELIQRATETITQEPQL
jgi:ABC-type transport system involved in Fe-S cluster assembly fused permease/ATPase subunit